MQSEMQLSAHHSLQVVPLSSYMQPFSSQAAALPAPHSVSSAADLHISSSLCFCRQDGVETFSLAMHVLV